jgi:hypothetical protein
LKWVHVAWSPLLEPPPFRAGEIQQTHAISSGPHEFRRQGLHSLSGLAILEGILACWRSYLLIHISRLLIIIGLVACQPISEPPAKSTPTLVVMADFFFSACAFLDANHNGTWDESDPPIEGAQMGLRIAEGQDFVLGDLTGPDGCASVWAPGGGIEVPFLVRMNPPENSGLIPINEGDLKYEGGPILRFLFRKP